MKKIFIKNNYLFFVEQSGEITNEHRSAVRIEPDDKTGLNYTISSPNIGIRKVVSTDLNKENDEP